MFIGASCRARKLVCPHNQGERDQWWTDCRRHLEIPEPLDEDSEWEVWRVATVRLNDSTSIRKVSVAYSSFSWLHHVQCRSTYSTLYYSVGSIARI